MTSTRHSRPYDAYDLPYLTFDPRTSKFYEESPYPRLSRRMSRNHESNQASSSTIRPLRVSKTPSRPPSLPPLYFEPARESYLSTSTEDEPVSPLPFATLKRSSHIRRKERPQMQQNKAHMSRYSLPRIVTDFSPRESAQPAPPVAETQSKHPPTPLSATSPTPSMKGTPNRYSSPEHSPNSVYSAPSAHRGASIYVEWDTTGYLQPEGEHRHIRKEPPELEVEGGVLKRQKTAVIVELLRARRRKAGME